MSNKQNHRFHNPRINTSVPNPKGSEYLLKLSKKMANALRHAPWDYGLDVDDEGWVDSQQLVDALRKRFGRDDIVVEDFQAILDWSDKKRYEISGNRIRACYGHTFPVMLNKAPSVPPEILYHGTSHSAADIIVVEGLQPIGRQYVHMSDNYPLAHGVGMRKDQHPVILVVRAGDAYRAGILFYDANDCIWLADHIPPEFIDR